MKKVIPGLKVQIILDVIYFSLLPFVIVFYLLKKKYHWGWLERLGLGNWRKILNQEGKFIWVHSVSLGEARLGYLVYSRLKREYPSYRFLLTTVTTTGYSFLKRNLYPEDFLAYLPLDFSFLVRRIFQKLDIRLLLILETELWPNLIIASAKYNCPSGLINARISRRAFCRYRKLYFLFARIINILDFIVASGEKNMERFLTLGGEKGRCFTIGSLKFDLEPPGVREEGRILKLADYLREKKLKLLVAGSTHYPEDISILELYFQIKEKYSDWALLIAPRHPDRIHGLNEFLKSKGISPVFFSSGFKFKDDISIFVLDEVGYLASFYSLGELIFVGGSLIPRGGHNIIEPAFFKKAIFLGPHYDNFEDIVEEFNNNSAVVILDKEKPMFPQIEDLIQNSDIRTQLGERAYQVVMKNRGNIERVFRVINRRLR
ncbi:MAG: hypothetical protein J7J54_05550 [Candidatus Omnitrophica bacterium]|nr:hypothetical protein [Candidatus Omnitrophota bacterium]